MVVSLMCREVSSPNTTLVFPLSDLTVTEFQGLSLSIFLMMIYKYICGHISTYICREAICVCIDYCHGDVDCII